MNQKVTIKDVAELAGVSKSTVSRYLNQGYISVEKQERVKKAIEQTGFKSNFFAKRLKTKQSKLIGIVLPRMDSVTVGKLLAGISRILEPAGYQGLLLVSKLSGRKEIENIRSLQQQGVDGILVDSVGISEEHVKLTKSGTVPVLYTGQKHQDVPYVKIDDKAAGRMMGAYLRQMGHKHAVFAGVTENSVDSVSDRDYCIEFTGDFAMLQAHLSRMCEEIVLWSTTEFSFIELSEKWSTGSSIMPQKKNPDFAELIRGRTGKVYGDLINLLTMVKGLPLAYDRDMQEDKEPLFDALDTVEANLKVFTAMVSSAKWNTEKLEQSVEGGFANATDVAEYLVRKGMPFRTAHSVAASTVRRAIDKGLSRIEDLPLADLQECSPLIGEDIFGKISPRACMEGRKTKGGPSPERVREQLEVLGVFCKERRKNAPSL